MADYQATDGLSRPVRRERVRPSPWRRVSCLIGAGALLLALPLLADRASAAECTNTWVGPAGAGWEVAEYWSAESVPTSTDVVCVPAEETVVIDGGARQAEVLQGLGSVRILAGSLTIASSEEPSNIGTLRLEGGLVNGPFELHITELLAGNGATIGGVGTTIVGAEAMARINDTGEEGPPGLRVTNTNELRVHGSMAINGPAGKLVVLSGATLSDYGEVSLNGSSAVLRGDTGHVDTLGAGSMAAPGGEASLRFEGGTLDNAGTLSIEGTAVRLVALDGAVLTNRGDLMVSGKEGFVRLIDSRIDNEEGATLDATGAEFEARLEAGWIRNFGNLGLLGLETRVYGDQAGRLDNDGLTRLHAEGAGMGFVAGTEGARPVLRNRGVFKKVEGIGVTYVGFQINNEGTLRTETGTLAFTGGGNSGEEEKSWVADEEARLRLVEGVYNQGPSVQVVGEVKVEDAATLRAQRYAAGASWIEVLEGGQVKISATAEKSQFGELDLVGAEMEVPAEGEASFASLGLAEGTMIARQDAVLEPSEVFHVSGTLDIKPSAHLSVAGEITQEDGLVEVGSDAQATIDAIAVIGGTFAVDDAGSLGSASGVYMSEGEISTGLDSTVAIGQLAQEGGTLSIASTENLAIGPFAQEGGSVTLGSGTAGTVTSFLRYAGSLTMGESSSLSGEYFTQYEGLTALANGAAMDFQATFMEGGQLDLDEAATATSTDDLFVVAGNVTGAGNIVVDDHLFWSGGMLAGSGLVHARGGGFVYEGGESDEVTLQGRVLLIEDQFWMESSTLAMSNGAVLRTDEEFVADSETGGHGAQIHIASNSSSPPRIVNRGRFVKLSGSGITTVGPRFENFGSVGAESGDLDFENPVNLLASEVFGNRCYCADPVESSTGDFSESQTDIAVGGLGMGLTLTRTYSAQAAVSAELPGPFGYGWHTSFTDRLLLEGAKATVVKADGSTIPFEKSEGEFVSPVWSEATLVADPEGGYVFKDIDQVAYRLSEGGKLVAVTDRNGNATLLSYDEAGQLETIEDPAGRQLNLAYDESGLVSAAEDPMGHVVEYAYEGTDLAAVTLPGEEAPRWQFEYDEAHRLTTMIDGRGGETVNEYDEEDRVVSQTDPAERTTSIAYEPFHTRITNEETGSVTDQWFTTYNQPFSISVGVGTPSEATETFTYDDDGRLIARVDGNGHATTYGYDKEGNRTSEKSPMGHEWKWTYNTNHDVISETTPRGETTMIERDANGNVETVSRPAPGEVTQATTFAYYGNGQLKSLTDPLERTWSYGYNGQGDLTSEEDPLGNLQTFGYDENSRLAWTVAPRGNAEGTEPVDYTTTIDRDAQGRPVKVTDQLERVTEYAYDGNGNLQSTINAKGNTTSYTYNGADELTKTELPNGDTLETGYDGSGEIVSQTDGNEETTEIVRDAVGLPVEVVDPLERTTLNEFDDAGNLVGVTDPAERQVTYSFDKDNLLTAVDYSDEATADESFEYDADGNLIAMIDGSGESSFDFDPLGRLTGVEDGHGAVIGYQYNLADEQVEVTYPNEKSVTRAFDDAGRMESVTDWLGGVTSFEYDPDSNLTAIEFPSGTGNVDEFLFDRAGGMSEARFRAGEAMLASLGYSRDQLGQIESTESSGLPGFEELSYGYDKAERLVEAGAFEFGYDPAGNLTEAPGTTNTYDAAGQLESGTDVTYDYSSLGERTEASPKSGPVTTYGYDQAGRLTSIDRPEGEEAPGIEESFGYDGAGLLVSRVVGESTNHLTWDRSGNLPLLVDDGVRSFVYGPGNLPIAQISSGEPTYLHHDSLGSTRLLTDAAGEATGTFSYTPYGSLEASTGSATTPLGYAGEYTDSLSGLQYLRARFYDPATGQFMSPDPMRALTRSPYAYVYNSPINYDDPTGYGLFEDLWSAGGDVLDFLDPVEQYKMAKADAESGDIWGSRLHSFVAGCTLPLELLPGKRAATTAKRFAQVAGRRRAAKNLTEQLAMKEAKSIDPTDLPTIRRRLGDPRWPSSEGWVKKAAHVNGVEIHFNYNKITKETDDWKYIDYDR